MNRKNNIIDLKQWLGRAKLVQSATSVGWSVKNADLGDISDLAVFYLCEPIQTQFSAIAVFDRRDLRRFVDGGFEKLSRESAERPTRESFFEAAGTLAKETIQKKLPSDDEMFRLMMFANFVNFSTTQTAKLALQTDKDIHHFGAIVYDNPKRKDGVELSLRPFALENKERIIEPGIVALAVSNYILFDFENHPEYFEGLDVVSVVGKLLMPFPDILQN